jgi:Fe-S cluster assembly iron-binding protein IscA
MIEITDPAKRLIMEVLDRNPGKHLRIVVEGNGCAGPYLSLCLDEAEPHEGIVKVNGLDILMSEDVKNYAEAGTINLFFNPSGIERL